METTTASSSSNNYNKNNNNNNNNSKNSSNNSNNNNDQQHSYKVIIAHTGIEYEVPKLPQCAGLADFKDRIAQVTGVVSRCQILLIQKASVSQRASNQNQNLDANSYYYTVPKGKDIVNDAMGDESNRSNSIIRNTIYLFDRNVNVDHSSSSSSLSSVATNVSIRSSSGLTYDACVERIQNIARSNRAAWENYQYHKANFIATERSFSKEFLKYDEEHAKPLLFLQEKLLASGDSKQKFSEIITNKTMSVSLEPCLSEFLSRRSAPFAKESSDAENKEKKKYTTLYDTIPVDKVVQWYEFCLQSRDALCGKYDEVHAFTEALYSDASNETEAAANMSLDVDHFIGSNSLAISAHDYEAIQTAYQRAIAQLLQNLSRIKEFQTSIRSSISAIHFLKDALKKHSEHLQYLKIVIGWPEVFDDINTELRRRAIYGSNLHDTVDNLKKLQEEEVQIRQQFISKTRSKCMPLFADIINQMPPSLQLSKENLPSFDLSAEKVQHLDSSTSSSLVKQDTATNISTVSSLQDEISQLKKENEKLRQELNSEKNARLHDKKLKELEHQNYPSNKISHTSFKVNDFALFMPTGRRFRRDDKKFPIFLAFHSNTPHRYLSHESLSLSESSSPPDYVLGRIVMIDECLSAVGKKNEYGVPPGLKYWVLTVEVLKKPQ